MIHNIVARKYNVKMRNEVKRIAFSITSEPSKGGILHSGTYVIKELNCSSGATSGSEAIFSLDKNTVSKSYSLVL